METKKGYFITDVDRFLYLLEQKKIISIKELSQNLGLSENLLEKWAEVFEKKGIINIKYPLLKSLILEYKNPNKLVNNDLDVDLEESRTENKNGKKPKKSLFNFFKKSKPNITKKEPINSSNNISENEILDKLESKESLKSVKNIKLNKFNKSNTLEKIDKQAKKKRVSLINEKDNDLDVKSKSKITGSVDIDEIRKKRIKAHRINILKKRIKHLHKSKNDR